MPLYHSPIAVLRHGFTRPTLGVALPPGDRDSVSIQTREDNGFYPAVVSLTPRRAFQNGGPREIRTLTRVD